jgi:NitT/TauT family transport system ATP-binding protein
MSHIEINIRSKTYSAVESATSNKVIENLKLTLNTNEFVCLVGPSGCGKTTLLNIIADLDKAYEGQVLVGSNKVPPKIGYIFQNPRLLPWLTVRENIELVLQEGQSVEDIDSLLEVMKLTQSQHVYPERLSLGMSRRVSIIRAFAVNPDVLLMDEPFVSLDAPTARQVRELLLRLWENRPHTVLFVTHDLREAIALADRIVFLSAAPMRVVSEISVPLLRVEREKEACIDQFRQQLLNQYPEIKRLL